MTQEEILKMVQRDGGMGDKLSEIAARYSYVEGFNGVLAEYRAASVSRHLPLSTEGALDIGAGEGALAKKLCWQFERYVAIEPAQNYAQKLRELKIETHEVLFENFKTERLFNAVFCLGVLEHVEDPVAMIRHAYRLLAPRGVLCITVPNAFSLHRVVALANDFLSWPNELQAHDKIVGHERYYDYLWLVRDIIEGTQCKQSDILVEGIMLKPLPNSKMDIFTQEQLDMFATYAIRNVVNAAELLVVVRKP